MVPKIDLLKVIAVKLQRPSLRLYTLQVIEPMEETRSQLVMVTEPVFASAENLLRRFEGLPRGLMQARKDVKLSELEVKAGLLQVCGGLSLPPCLSPLRMLYRM